VTRVAAFLRKDWPTPLVVAALVVTYLALRTPATQIASADLFVAELAGGQPSIVEFYSNA
jgi:hypothetical protein